MKHTILREPTYLNMTVLTVRVDYVGNQIDPEG